MIPNEKKQTENISCPEYLNINRWFNADVECQQSGALQNPQTNTQRIDSVIIYFKQPL